MSIKKTVIAILCAAAFLTLSGCDSQDYKTALGMIENQQWFEARDMFVALEDYKDSADMLTECDYNIALSVMESGEYEDALAKFEALNGYKDSAGKITECSYQIAVALQDAGEYDKAIDAFEALGDYEDCADRVTECTYKSAMAHYDAEEYEEALSLFQSLEDYKDAVHYVVVCRLLTDSYGYVSEFASNMDSDFMKYGIPYLLAERDSSGYDERVYRVVGLEASEKTHVYFTNITSNWTTHRMGEINGVIVMGTAGSAEEIELVYPEVVFTAGTALAQLDNTSTPEDLILMLNTEFERLAAEEFAEITGNSYTNYEFEHNGYNCYLAVSEIGDNFRFIFSVSVPELITE